MNRNTIEFQRRLNSVKCNGERDSFSEFMEIMTGETPEYDFDSYKYVDKDMELMFEIWNFAYGGGFEDGYDYALKSKK